MSRDSQAIIVAAAYLTLLVCGFCGGNHPAEARDQCTRPAYMQTTVECNRIPTVEKPYCPFP